MSIEEKLRAALAPVSLHIQDDSHKHAGHKGNTGGSHLTLTIVSERFTGLSALQRHKLVYQVLADEMKGQIHALAIDARSPEEATADER